MSFESLNPDRKRTRRALVRASCSFGLALPLWLLSVPVSAQNPPTPQQTGGPVLDEPRSENAAYDIQNPFAFIPRLPIENQFDFDAGPDRDVMRYALRPRPVIPFRLTDDLALITRTTFNIVYQEDGLAPGDSDEFGLGDTDMELFLSPRRAAREGRSSTAQARSCASTPRRTTRSEATNGARVRPPSRLATRPHGRDLGVDVRLLREPSVGRRER
jgi:hypothetical protein